MMNKPTDQDIVYNTPRLSDAAKVRAAAMYCHGLLEDFPENENLAIAISNVLKILEDAEN